MKVSKKIFNFEETSLLDTYQLIPPNKHAWKKHVCDTAACIYIGNTR